MAALPSLQHRLNNPDLSDMEASQRSVFIHILESLGLPSHAHALSVSVGDGIWDYLCFTGNRHISRITATDIVVNPVKKEDIAFLREHGTWDFVKVPAEKKLPFKDESFDLIFHHDVVEHVHKPYLFLSEQYRVLKKGGTLVFGTPNLFRPANILKLLTGKLYFPVNIGSNDDIGEYIHIQEFYEEQMNVMLREVGFTTIKNYHCYFGLYFLQMTFSAVPTSRVGKGLCHYLQFAAIKK